MINFEEKLELLTDTRYLLEEFLTGALQRGTNRCSFCYEMRLFETAKQAKEGGFDADFVDHTTGIYPQSDSGVPWRAATFQSKGDPITDLFEDMAAEATPLQEQSFRLFAPF